MMNWKRHSVCRTYLPDCRRRFSENRDEIVINKYLAEGNGIQVGEKILLQSMEQQTVEAVVTGFFLVGGEERQTDNVATVNRIENQLYATTDFVNTL